MILTPSREAGCQAALDGGASHVLLLDPDLWPPKGLLPCLLRWCYPAVAAAQRSPHGVLAAGRFAAGYLWQPLRWPTPNGLLVEVAGAGCLLLDTRLLRRLEPPWFASVLGPSAATSASEDTAFCFRLGQELGLPLLLDSQAACRRALPVGVWPGGKAEP